MSFEDKMHKKIEEGNSEEKKVAWESLSSKLDFPMEMDEVKVIDGRKKIIWIGAIGLLFFLFLLIFLAIFFNKQEDKLRYCTFSDYTIVDTQQTLKEFSAQRGEKILYFDWYEITSFRASKVAELNSKHEVVCFFETICDENTGNELAISITDDHTVLDILERYDVICNQTSAKDDRVKWGNGEIDSYAMFDYKGYKYYIMVKEADSPDLAMDYALMLLSKQN